MTPDATCPRCQAPVVLALDHDLLPLHVDPQPDEKHGVAWIVARAHGLPVMRIAWVPNDVPRREPLRYVPHSCLRGVTIVTNGSETDPHEER